MNKATVKTFTFEELSEEAPPHRPRFVSSPSPKDRARQWLQEGAWMTCEYTLPDLFETELSERGLSGLTTLYDLSYSQGSGVAFEGSLTVSEIKPIVGTGEEDDRGHIERIRSILGAIKAIGMTASGEIIPDSESVAADAFVKIKNFDNHYTHSRTFGIDWEDSWRRVEVYDSENEVIDITEEQDKALAEAIIEWLRDLSHSFEKMGYAEIEYQSSDESFAETCEANGYLFSEQGEPIHHLIEEEQE